MVYILSAKCASFILRKTFANFKQNEKKKKTVEFQQNGEQFMVISISVAWIFWLKSQLKSMNKRKLSIKEVRREWKQNKKFRSEVISHEMVLFPAVSYQL